MKMNIEPQGRKEGAKQFFQIKVFLRIRGLVRSGIE
jgi:hypothetical protein